MLLGVLLMGALAAATYTFVTAKGKGVAEDPTRVMLVDESAESRGDPLLTLERNGFVGSQRLPEAQWSEIAREEGIDEGDFVLAMLELADTQGFGYVAFDEPHLHDFSSLDETDVEIPSEAELRQASYLVVSAGELSHPHRITLGPPRSEVVRVAGIGLLEALMDQQRFDPNRELLLHRPSVDELKLEETIKPARNLVQARERIEREAREMAVAQEEANYGGVGLPVLGVGEAGGAIPLRDGSMLEVARAVDVHSDNGRRINLDLSDAISLRRSSQRDGGNLGLGDLPDTMEVFGRPEYLPSPGGSHLVVKTSYGSTLYELRAEGFASIGEVSLPDRTTEAKFGEVTDLGVVLRPFVIDGAGGIRMYWSDGTRAPLGPVEGVVLASPRLIWTGESDSAVVAAVGMRVDEDGEAQQSLFLLGPSGSGSVYELSGTLFDGQPIVELAQAPPASGEEGATIYAVVGKKARTVVRVELDASLMARVSTLSPPDGDGWTSGVVSLGEDDVAVATIAGAAGIRELFVANDGRHAVASTPDHRVVLLPLIEPGAVVPVPVDSRSGLPRFTADGSALVFESRVTMGVLRREVIVPRIVYLDDLEAADPEDSDS